MKKNMSQDIAKLGFQLLPCITHLSQVWRN